MRAFFDNLRLALGTFAGNPLRSLLTLLGIVIGVATVVSAMGLIEGLRRKVNDDLSMLGPNVFEISKYPAMSMGPRDWKKLSARPDLRPADMQAILDGCPSVGAASMAAYRRGKIRSDRAETRPDTLAIGATALYVETGALTLHAGRFFNDAEDLDARPVAVIGVDVVDALFPQQEPLGQQIRVGGRQLRVIGVLQRRGSVMGMTSLDNRIVLPFNTFTRIFGDVRSYDIEVQARDGAVFARAQDEVVSLLRRRRGLRPDEEDDFELYTNESNTEMVNQFSSLISLAGFGICVLSLIVGGIGILNIMLVSVTERTREIGVRKALGARRRRILAQFATEAVVLSLVGGLIGIGLGYGVAFGVKWTLAMPTAVPLWAVLLAVGMSSGVGLVFGIYPAARAARLDPVEAMRSE